MGSLNIYFDVLYPDEQLEQLFRVETGLTVDQIYIREFRNWVKSKITCRVGNRGWENIHDWLVMKLHEFEMLNP